MPSDFRSYGGSYPRGMRNNNPTNISDTTTGWQGQVGSDGRFAIFENISWGIRAYLNNYFSSVKKHNTDTIAKYITRFAPPSENDTTAYINKVASNAGVDPDAPIPTDKETVKKIMRAQFEQEVGKSYADKITDDDIETAFTLLDSPLKSFYNSITVFYHSNPVATYGIATAVAIGASLLVLGGIKLLRYSRKK